MLIACEESQTICKAFRSVGVISFSNDIQDCSGGHPEWHIKSDVMNLDLSDFYAIIAHPPCTYLSNCQPVKLFENDPCRYDLSYKAAEFFMFFYNLPHKYICIENPLPRKFVNLPPYSQIIQPYNFGEPFSKRTCLWLKGFPCLMNTCICESYLQWTNYTNHTSKARSKFFPAVAAAMANQWKYIFF